VLVGQCASCGAPATLGCTICGRTFCRACLDSDERMCGDCRQAQKQVKSPIEARPPPSRRVVRRPPLQGQVQ
jgi:hypothetical protein